MGNFKIVIEATGGHGCSREINDGGTVYGCYNMNCPDCRTREFVETMKRIASVNSAEFIHWPGEKGEVRDNLITKIRTGNF